MHKHFKSKPKYSLIKILTGSDLSSRKLALMELKSDKPGPVVWLTGCVHGDEIGGIVIIQEIFKRLKKYPLLRGSVYAFPLMNPIGFESASRNIIVSEEDLNRSFPGDVGGSLAERIADKIFSAIKKTNPTVVLDIHNDWLQSIPYTLLDPYPGLKHKEAYDKTKEFCLQTGFLVINEQEFAEESEDLKKTLTGSLIMHNIPALTLEVGGANKYSSIYEQEDIADGVLSIWNVLAHLKMVDSLKEKFNYQMPTNLKNKILKYSHQPVSSKSGLIKFLVKPGEIVRKGQPVARIYNVFGKVQETMVAQDESIVLGVTDYSVAYPGAEILAFAVL